MSFLSSWLPFGFVRASDKARSEALASRPIEEQDTPDASPTLIVGGHQTKGALPLRSQHLNGAVYSSRGRGYAWYNEDAAGIFTDARGWMYAFALDQAGGLGGKVRGRASALAAVRLWQACRMIATSKDDDMDPSGILVRAFREAHRSLVDRGQGEVTTAVVAVITPKVAYLVNSGDSGALHIDQSGEVKARTEMHEMAPPNQGCLLNALGLLPEGCAPDAYRWDINPGDWLILGSDGMLDAGLEDDALGGLLAASNDAEDGVNRVCRTILRRMGTNRAKPDNLTVVALKALESPGSRAVTLGVGS